MVVSTRKTVDALPAWNRLQLEVGRIGVRAAEMYEGYLHSKAEGTAARGGEASRPPNLSPEGAGRSGALREAKRRNGIPAGQQPKQVRPNQDRRGNPQPGKQYDFENPRGPEYPDITIRDDAAGHDFGPGAPQNRGPHFNDPDGNHYDY